MSQVHYFLAVAEELNFTRAAERCGVSQPSLTRAIKLLEHEFGGPLFHRERRNTHLTDLGRMVHPYLADIYAAASASRHLAREYARLDRTPLKLGIMCTIAPDEFIGLITAIRAEHPGIELQLCDDTAKRLRTRLIEGDLEVAIYASPGGEPDGRTHVLPLFRERMIMVVHPRHPRAGQGSVRIEEVNGERYVQRNNCEFIGFADAVLEEQGITPAYRSERDDWALAMVAAGLGFGILPANSAGHPGVVALPLVEPEFLREVGLVSVRGRPHSPAAGALVREAMRKKWFGRSALGVSPAPAERRHTV
ncbi:LysR family transcriptional regulator [Belnapia sp. T18]|uniref:LysR family transcriptional regulator n=1 Tax=Belnapia arida TaxID=2804533 RepID=A0ABS1UD16_9PROT|nr:LysR family transcriptional regulator [Belnapia arida]MBL6082045.1 LysR family transcriptional regulator [Belnapia arida]